MFQIRSAYNHKVFKEMARTLRKTSLRKRSLFTRAFGWTVVVLAALVQVLTRSPDVLSILTGTLVLVVLLFEDDLNAWAASANLLPGAREADTLFEPDEYVVATRAATTHMRYENIRLVCETKDSFLFIIGKRHVQQFPKAGMVKGTPEEFRAFMAEKTGLAVRYVK